MADVTYIPDGNSQMNGYLPWMLASNGGFSGWGGGLGTGILGFLLGALVNNGGFGGLFGGGNWGNGAAGAGFLSNQISNDSGRELLMNAITSQGEAGRAATQNLATMLGQDFNLVNGGVSAIRDGIAALTSQTGMSALQIVNAIQAGNSDLASQLCKCCCDQRQLALFCRPFRKGSYELREKQALYDELRKVIADPAEKKPHLVVMTVIILLRTRRSFKSPLPGSLNSCREDIFGALGLDAKKCHSYTDDSLKKGHTPSLLKYKDKAEATIKTAFGNTR